MAIVPRTIVLKGGLDLRRSRHDVDPGTLSDCLNWESTGKADGYRQCLGFRSFSGGVINAVENPYIVYSISGSSNATFSIQNAFNAGDVLTWGSGGTIDPETRQLTTYDGSCLVSLIDVTVSTQRYALCGFRGRLPVVGDVLSNGSETATLTSPLLTAEQYIDAGKTWNGYANTVDAQTLLIDNFRLFPVSGLPYGLPMASNGFCAGGFRWMNRAHVVLDIEEWSFTSGNAEPAKGATLRIYYTGSNPAVTYLEYEVEEVVTETGAWASGTAAGRIFVIPKESAYYFGGVTAPTSVYNFTTSTNTPFTFGTLQRSTRAALWRDTTPYSKTGSRFSQSAKNGWERCDLGHEVQFRDGDIAIPVLNRAALYSQITTTSQPTALQVKSTAFLLPTVATSVWTNPNNALTDDGTGAKRQVLSTPTPPLTLTDLNADIPLNSVIVGIEVQIKRQNDDAAAGQEAKDFVVELVGIDGTSQNKAKQDLWPKGAYGTVTYGSATDTWGAALTPAVINSEDFGIRFIGIGTTGSSGTWDFDIDFIKVKIHYRDPSPTIYFYNTVTATDVAIGKALWYYKNADTDWGAATKARGVLTVYELTTTEADAIVDGCQIRSDAAGGGTLYAVAASKGQRVYLPSSSQVSARRSQWEFESHNFHANAYTEQVFGTSGAGPAISWDGDFAIRIRTGIEFSQDIPRHVGVHHTQLALAYESGSLVLSDNNYPESFAGVEGGSSPISDDPFLGPNFSRGAAVFTMGDAIHGVMSLQRQVLGVFCKKSIKSLVGVGASSSIDIISPNIGIIEFTLAELGVPIFATFNGVETLATTDKYDQFQREPLSEAVTDWLVPRLQEIGSVVGTNRGPFRGEVIRSNRQYKLYFNDKYVLTVTLKPGAPAECTIQTLPFAPTCLFSAVDSSGKDYAFMSTHGSRAVGSADNELLALYGADTAYKPHANIQVGTFLYEINGGVDWDGLMQIPGYIDLNGGALTGEKNTNTFKHAIVSGKMYGFASFGAKYALDYGDVETTATQGINAGSLAAAGARAYKQRAFSKTHPINREGFALSIRYESYGPLVDGETTAQSAPYKWRPATLQAVSIFMEIEKPKE